MHVLCEASQCFVLLWRGKCFSSPSDPIGPATRIHQVLEFKVNLQWEVLVWYYSIATEVSVNTVVSAACGNCIITTVTMTVAVECAGYDAVG